MKIKSVLFLTKKREKLEADEVDKLILNSSCSEIMDEVMDLGDAYPLDCKINPGNKSYSSPNDRKKSRSKSNKKGSK
jgi:hypothetical protein